MTFALYGPGDDGCATPLTSAGVAVSGNGIYSSAPFAASAAGVYRWVAAYGGDANNLSAGPERVQRSGRRGDGDRASGRRHAAAGRRAATATATAAAAVAPPAPPPLPRRRGGGAALERVRVLVAAR